MIGLAVTLGSHCVEAAGYNQLGAGIASCGIWAAISTRGVGIDTCLERGTIPSLLALWHITKAEAGVLATVTLVVTQSLAEPGLGNK